MSGKAASPEPGRAAWALQLAGLGIWGALAVRARRSDAALWGGCAAHALWDAAHFQRVGFVPGSYAAACLAPDVGLGGYILVRLRERRPVAGLDDPSDEPKPEPGAPP